MGNYAPDWAIAFEKGSVRHIFFVAETKGSMDSLTLRDIERDKIACARRLFNEFSDEDVCYDVVYSYEDLLAVIQGTEWVLARVDFRLGRWDADGHPKPERIREANARTSCHWLHESFGLCLHVGQGPFLFMLASCRTRCL